MDSYRDHRELQDGQELSEMLMIKLPSNFDKPVDVSYETHIADFVLATKPHCMAKIIETEHTSPSDYYKFVKSEIAREEQLRITHANMYDLHTETFTDYYFNAPEDFRLLRFFDKQQEQYVTENMLKARENYKIMSNILPVVDTELTVITGEDIATEMNKQLNLDHNSTILFFTNLKL